MKRTSLLKRRLLVFLVMLLIAGSYPVQWVSDGVAHAAAEDFEGGEGTAENPFQIATAEQLVAINSHLDSHFILINDIDMSAYNESSSWEPIGDSTNPFTGQLNGQNYTISNLLIDKSIVNVPTGLFGVLGNTSRIRNLTIENADIKGLDNTAILAGISNGATIELVSVSGNVQGQQNIGGFIGKIVGGSMTNNYATSEVNGERNVGGFAGSAQNANLSHNYATGEVTGSRTIGGLVGSIEEGSVSYSYATGNISGSIDVGGLVGQLNEEVLVSASYATGAVLGCEDVGGLVGDNDDNSLIINSYATGAVTGDGHLPSCPGYSDSIGGLVGDSKGGRVENSFSIGKVTGESPISGLIGITGSGSIINSYFNLETSGQPDSDGQGRTNEQMKDRANFIGWDFDTLWEMDPRHHDGYPYLKQLQVYVTYVENESELAEGEYWSEHSSPGSAVIIQEVPEAWGKAGYISDGWNTADDGSGEHYQAQDSINLNENVLLYVNWIQPNAPTLLTPVHDSYMNHPSPVFSGTGDEGLTLVILLDGQEAATMMIGGDRSWSWTPSVELEDGEHTVQAGILDSTGQPVGLTTEHTFTVDTVAPVITLLGNETITLNEGTAFVDPGVHVTDIDDETELVITGSVDHQEPGIYTLHYDATDRAGNAAVTVSRTVQVVKRSSGGGYSLSVNNDLASLAVIADDEKLTLTPSFTADTTSYKVETTAQRVRIEVIADHPNASVTLIQKLQQGTETSETSLDESRVVELLEGSNEFRIQVRAESGNVKVYTLLIQRLTISEHESAGTCPFNDIKGHWAEAFICDALDKGIVDGYPDATFQPQERISRVEYLTMLLRTLNISPSYVDVEHHYSDVHNIPAWAAAVIHTAIDKNIMQGYPDDTLRPLQLVNRSEMVVMMARALNWANEQNETTFTDDSDVPVWAKGYIHEAEQRKLVVGRLGNHFSPLQTATRAEAVTMLLRMWYDLNDRENIVS